MSPHADLPPSAPLPVSLSRERLVLLTSGSMRARRRPGAIAAVYLWQLVTGAVLLGPAASVVRATWSSHPDGDGPLFADGGLDLVELVLHPGNAGPSLFSHIALLSAVAWAASVVPLSFLLFALAHTTVTLDAPRARHLLPRVAETVVPLLVLLGLSSALLLALGGAGLWLGAAATRALESALGEAWGDALGVLAGLVFLVPAACVGVVHDLASAAVVRWRAGPAQALRVAAAAFGHAPAHLVWSWLWRALAALVPVGAMAVVAIRLGGRPGGVLGVLFVLHQLVVFSRVALRASWLARALRAVDSTSVSPRPPNKQELSAGP